EQHTRSGGDLLGAFVGDPGPGGLRVPPAGFDFIFQKILIIQKLLLRLWETDYTIHSNEFVGEGLPESIHTDWLPPQAGSLYAHHREAAFALPPARPQPQGARLYAHRAAGGDRRHRSSGFAALAGGAAGPRGGPPRPLQEQSQADRPGPAQLRGCTADISSV